jgi:hypothetical protein
MSETPKDDPPPRGRPKAEEPGASITAWVPQSEYDRLCRLANQREESLSALVRELLKLKRSD